MFSYNQEVKILDKIRVALVDDHSILRQSLAKAISSEFDIEVIGQWGSAEEALEALQKEPCDVVIMDLKLPKMSGVTATQMLHGICPRVKVIILSAYVEDNDLYESIQAGALGYLPKEVTIEELVDAIRSVYRGYAVLNPQVTRKVLEQFTSLQNRLQSEHEISYLEQKILSMAAAGFTNKEIGDKLNLNDGAVKFHFREIYRKLGAKDRAHAVAIALKQGLIE